MKTQLPATYNLALKHAVIDSRQTQRAVAARAGIENTRFSKILNGIYQATADERRRLARILGRPVSELFPSREAVA